MGKIGYIVIFRGDILLYSHFACEKFSYEKNHSHFEGGRGGGGREANGGTSSAYL